MDPEFCPETGIPLAIREASPIRIILPNPAGEAIGEVKETDTESVAISTSIKGVAKSIRYGVAYVPRGGTAEAGALGAAVAHTSGVAKSGDGGVSFVWNGTSSAGSGAVSYTRKGDATVAHSGVAVTLLGALSTALSGGVSIALNYRIVGNTMVTDSSVGSVQAGKSSVVVAFRKTQNASDETDRSPVVGIIGAKPACITPEIEAQLLAHGIQFGLQADSKYKLDASGKFVISA